MGYMHKSILEIHEALKNKEVTSKELVEESQRKITQLTRKYKELCSISGLPTKMERMRVSGYRRTSVAKMK